MLEPQNRAILLHALRPPDGFRIDAAVATTFTLDLTALLVAPLAFSFYDELFSRERARAGAEPVDGVDPYALLKAVREHAQRVTVFCQAARIGAPARYRRLMAYLESSVVQVQPAADDAVFHPKLWVLRFTRDADDEVRYRLLCASRNLTFDRSWDTLLVLDGELTSRAKAFAGNHPLGDLLASLPELAVTAMEPPRRDTTLRMADELRRVRFELPDGVESMKFHALGLDRHRGWPFQEKIDRLLVVSPFVSTETLQRLGRAGRDDVLVSRVDQLQAVPLSALSSFSNVHVLDSGAELEDEELAAGAGGDHSVQLEDHVANGLHAKVYVADDGWDAHVWTGSANATDAAFGRNVELLVQLTGKKRLLGVDAVLDGKNGSSGLRALLANFTAPAEPVRPSEVECRLERCLQKNRALVGRAPWVAVVGSEREGRFPLALLVKGSALALPAGVSMKVWPVTLPEHRSQAARAPLEGAVAEFGECSFDALTSFFAFRMQAAEGEARLEATFVLNVRLEGAPENRAGRILQTLLDEPSKVLRFVHLLLATEPADAFDADEVELKESARSAGTSPAQGAGLLESLLQALDRDPARIDAVDQLVRDLAAVPGSAAALPAGFEAIWQPIRAAHLAQREGGRR